MWFFEFWDPVAMLFQQSLVALLGLHLPKDSIDSIPIDTKNTNQCVCTKWLFLSEDIHVT